MRREVVSRMRSKWGLTKGVTLQKYIGGTDYSLNRPAQASLTRALQVEELNLERRLDRLPGQAA